MTAIETSYIKKRIKETKFNREIVFNLHQYSKFVSDGGEQLYSKEELEQLKEAGVADRLPPRATKYYMNLAGKSEAIRNLIKARPEETEDLSGERDPSNQLRYSPVDGLLHKYELVLLYVVRACSAWCRYCYRSDFLTNKTEKDIAKVEQIIEYIKNYNEKVANLTDQDINNPEEKFPIREALLSGGDPMVLSNKNLFDYINGLASAGVRTVRLGTKELAFFPERFDDNFFDTLDFIHALHPDLNLAFMVHFTHPDEILLKNPKTGKYIKKDTGHFEKIPVVEKAVRRLRDRSYVTLENQTPIIYRVNDDAEALRRLQIELKRMGINNHYYFQCREIEGHRSFAVPVEEAWQIHKDSQKGLSGIEKSRFAMSTEEGKLEVVSVIDAPNFDKMSKTVPEPITNFLKSILEDGLVVLKLHRTPNVEKQGDLVIARRNPNALWISGYEDRIIYDGRRNRGDQFSPMFNILENLFSDSGSIKDIVGEEAFDDIKKAVA